MGQFGRTTWNIHDMSTVRTRPVYEREYFKKKRQEWIKFIEERLIQAHQKGLITAWYEEVELARKVALKKKGIIADETKPYVMKAQHINYDELPAEVAEAMGFTVEEEGKKPDFRVPGDEAEIDQEAFMDSSEDDEEDEFADCKGTNVFGGGRKGGFKRGGGQQSLTGPATEKHYYNHYYKKVERLTQPQLKKFDDLKWSYENELNSKKVWERHNPNDKIQENKN